MGCILLIGIRTQEDGSVKPLALNRTGLTGAHPCTGESAGVHQAPQPSHLRLNAVVDAGINVARVDLVSLRLAVLCAEAGTVSAAARIVPCSLSSASQRLSALEDAFGRKLFVRDHRGVQLTGAGEVFVAHARAVLAELRALMQRVGSE